MTFVLLERRPNLYKAGITAHGAQADACLPMPRQIMPASTPASLLSFYRLPPYHSSSSLPILAADHRRNRCRRQHRIAGVCAGVAMDLVSLGGGGRREGRRDGAAWEDALAPGVETGGKGTPAGKKKKKKRIGDDAAT